MLLHKFQFADIYLDIPRSFRSMSKIFLLIVPRFLRPSSTFFFTVDIGAFILCYTISYLYPYPIPLLRN